jgi:hypothetical protein
MGPGTGADIKSCDEGGLRRRTWTTVAESQAWKTERRHSDDAATSACAAQVERSSANRYQQRECEDAEEDLAERWPAFALLLLLLLR